MEKNISLVVLNYRSYDDTVTCVNQLLSFETKFHIIIVDNCSPDDSGKKLLDLYHNTPYVDVILSKDNRGYSAGNNIGFKYALEHYHSPIMGILNPDVLIPKQDVILSMAETLERFSEIAVVGGATLDRNRCFRPNAACWNIPTAKQISSYHRLGNRKRQQAEVIFNMLDDSIAQAQVIAGCFFLIKADILKGIGFLDEKIFLFNEENNLALTLKEKGYKEAIRLDAYYYHNHKLISHAIPMKKKLKATKAEYDSARYLLKKHYHGKRRFSLWWNEFIHNRIYLFLACLKHKGEK